MHKSILLLLLLVACASGTAPAFVCPTFPCGILQLLGLMLGYGFNVPFAFSTTLPSSGIVSAITSLIPDVAFSVGCNFGWANNFGILLPGVFNTSAGFLATGAFVGNGANVSGLIFDGKFLCLCI